MDYEIVWRDTSTVVGLEARTKNSDPNMKQMIGGLWQDFYQKGVYASIPNKTNPKPLGIYTGYEGDQNGTYTVLVACETTPDSPLPKGTVRYSIPKGKYARFIVRGDMVNAVGAFWEALWKMNLPRAFTCDFEEYQDDKMEDAEIHMYISLQDNCRPGHAPESRCGILCTQCDFLGKQCTGCLMMDKPFWGDCCPVKQCCKGKKHTHCGQCEQFPCQLLNKFSYDKEQGDQGARIAQCRKWARVKPVYQSVLLAVKDLEKSKQFYIDLLGMEVTEDFGANITLSNCVSLQTLDTWETFLQKPAKEIIFKNHAIELYFETEDMDGFLAQLEELQIPCVNPPAEQPWGQRGVRFYDPDGHIIEMGEAMHRVVKRFMAQGMTVQQVANRMDVQEDYVRAMSQL